jgi:hypothetical protein
MLVVKVEWIESERGWGQRPDGISLHISQKEAEKYIVKYWKDQTNDFVPDEYSYPEEPKSFDLNNKKIIKELKENKSIRIWNNELRKIKI